MQALLPKKQYQFYLCAERQDMSKRSAFREATIISSSLALSYSGLSAEVTKIGDVTARIETYLICRLHGRQDPFGGKLHRFYQTTAKLSSARNLILHILTLPASHSSFPKEFTPNTNPVVPIYKIPSRKPVVLSLGNNILPIYCILCFFHNKGSRGVQSLQH